MMYPPFNQPMQQFDVFHGMGFIVITIVDTSRWDFWYGFRRVVKQIKQPL